MSWEESTESPYLAGANLPDAGLACTLVSIRKDEMDKRDSPGKEIVYIGKFSDNPLEWVINKTGRRFLRETCGITNQNVQGFQPIPLTLYPNQTNLGVGIRPVQRVVTVAAPVIPQAAPAQTPVAPQTPPLDPGDVPF